MPSRRPSISWTNRDDIADNAAAESRVRGPPPSAFNFRTYAQPAAPSGGGRSRRSSATPADAPPPYQGAGGRSRRSSVTPVDPPPMYSSHRTSSSRVSVREEPRNDHTRRPSVADDRTYRPSGSHRPSEAHQSETRRDSRAVVPSTNYQSGSSRRPSETIRTHDISLPHYEPPRTIPGQEADGTYVVRPTYEYPAAPASVRRQATSRRTASTRRASVSHANRGGQTRTVATRNHRGLNRTWEINFFEYEEPRRVTGSIFLADQSNGVPGPEFLDINIDEAKKETKALFFSPGAWPPPDPTGEQTPRSRTMPAVYVNYECRRPGQAPPWIGLPPRNGRNNLGDNFIRAAYLDAKICDVYHEYYGTRGCHHHEVGHGMDWDGRMKKIVQHFMLDSSEFIELAN